jgi:hypothetical protein
MIPNMRQALRGWTKRLTIQIIKREIADHEVVEEVVAPQVISAVILPMKAREISIKSEGERTWLWWTMHTTESLMLGWTFIDVDTGKRYRVMASEDYSQGGFYKYDLVQRPKVGDQNV